MRDNLLDDMGDNPTKEDIVAWGEYDATIKQLTQELGLGPKEYTPGGEGGYIGDGSGGDQQVTNGAPGGGAAGSWGDEKTVDEIDDENLKRREETEGLSEAFMDTADGKPLSVHNK